MFKGMTKNSSFLCFMAIFMSNFPQFWGSKEIYMFESYYQTLVIFASYGRFHKLLPIILGFQGNLNDRKTRYMFKGMTKNSPFACFMAIFMSNCPQFWGSKAIYKFESYDQTLVVFAFNGNFHELWPIFLGFQGHLKRPQDTIHI